eukprot:s2648_g7.t1
MGYTARCINRCFFYFFLIGSLQTHRGKFLKRLWCRSPQRPEAPGRGSTGPLAASSLQLMQFVPRALFALGAKATGENRVQEFFTKPALSYGQYKQQCVSLRIFAFSGICGGCVLSLAIFPPKSSYWITWSPLYWLSYVKQCFTGAAPPLFLEKQQDGAQLVTNLLRAAEATLLLKVLMKIITADS